MEDALHILIGIVVIGFFILFWLLMFTRQDLKFMSQDQKRTEKTIDKIEDIVDRINFKNKLDKD